MENLKNEIRRYRKPAYKISKWIYSRWSPRSMTGEEIDDKTLFSLFEAARWAPSSFNEQPWIFCYAKKNTPSFEKFFNLLVDFNQSWCKNAAALVIILSRKNFQKTQKYSVTHSFDTGAAWACLALEGAQRGLVVHGMSGFDYEKAKMIVQADDSVQVEAMCALGKWDKKELLPLELQEKEYPSDRNPQSSFVFEGICKKP